MGKVPDRAKIREVVQKRRRRRGWTPFAGPQLRAYLAAKTVDQLGFGGAGGGGKTDLALGLALLQHKRAVFYRRQYTQLSGAIDRSRAVYRGRGKYNESRHRWSFKSKRVVQFAGMEREADKEKWRGIPFDLRVYDEAQNFLESQIRFVGAWTRTDDPDQHCLELFCFNPPTTPEGLWIIKFFAPWLDEEHPNPALPGEIRYFAMVRGMEVEVESGEPFEVDGELVTPKSRTFFPARVEDNPVYMKAGYKATLQALPEPLRSQMLRGDFRVGLEDDAWQVLPTSLTKAAMVRGRAGIPADAALVGLGSDIACGGVDRTTIARYYRFQEAGALRLRFGPMLFYPGRETPDGQTAAARIIEALGGSSVVPNVDIAGVGQGVRTALSLAGVEFNDVNFAAGSYGTDVSGKLRFANLRAEMYWRFREALERGEVDLPDDRELLAELCAARWSLTQAGIQLEPKDAIKKRLGRSPDLADAIVLAWYQAEVGGFSESPWGRR